MRDFGLEGGLAFPERHRQRQRTEGFGAEIGEKQLDQEVATNERAVEIHHEWRDETHLLVSH